jgi:hypothetical protein
MKDSGTLTGWFILSIVALSLQPPPAYARSAAEPVNAEFALRWNPQEGGPGSAEEVARLLGLAMPLPEAYYVRYFDLPRPSTAPAQASVILRERQKVGGKTQIRLKYRLEQPITGSWTCPPGHGFEQESEVDISWLADNKLKRTYSYSCTVKARQLPQALAATPKSCYSGMTRHTADDLKIEEWQLPGGRVQLEVSHSGTNTDDELRRFQEIARKLLKQGVQPADRSKTELGSECP